MKEFRLEIEFHGRIGKAEFDGRRVRLRVTERQRDRERDAGRERDSLEARRRMDGVNLFSPLLSSPLSQSRPSLSLFPLSLSLFLPFYLRLYLHISFPILFSHAPLFGSVNSFPGFLSFLFFCF